MTGSYNLYSYDCAAAFTVQLEFGGVIYHIPEKCQCSFACNRLL